MKFKDLGVSITVGGAPVEEYEVDSNKDTREMACWIASEAGTVRIILLTSETPLLSASATTGVLH